MITPYDVPIEIYKVGKIDYKIKCEMINNETGLNSPFYIYPRSSISNTEFMLANSVGIIDLNYRGSLLAKFRSFDNSVIKHITKLVQICSPTLEPFMIQLVDDLSESNRGENGFGSTNH